MKDIMQYIKTLIFGEKAKGVPLSPPSFKTREVKNRPTQDEWVKEFKFGSRYGHRGSFYNNN
jgi:hypothetical protein